MCTSNIGVSHQVGNAESGPSGFATIGITSQKSTCSPEQSIIPLVDWLEMRCEVNPDSPILAIENPGTHRFGDLGFSVRDYGTKFFANVATVTEHGEIVATVQWGDRIKGGNDCVVKIENQWFYRCVDLSGFVRGVLSSLGVKYLYTSQIDLALDGVDLSGLAKAYFSNQLIKKGRSEVVGRYDGSGGWTAFSMGNRAYKFLRWYNKTAEVQRNQTKGYITDLHKANGLEGDVHRLEISLKHAYLKTLVDFDLWAVLEDGETILTTWRTATQNWFDFAEATADSNKSRAKVVWTIENILGHVRTTFKRVFAKAAEGLHSAKVALKTLFKTGAMNGGRLVRTAMAVMMGNHKLVDWFDARSEKWVIEMEAYALLRGMTLDRQFMQNPLDR